MAMGESLLSAYRTVWDHSERSRVDTHGVHWNQAVGGDGVNNKIGKGFLISAHPFDEVEATYYCSSKCNVRKENSRLKTGYFVFKRFNL